MATYRWTINGQTMHGGTPLEVRKGERVRLVFDNQSTMFHPMHLHGHLPGPTGRSPAPGPQDGHGHRAPWGASDR